MISPADALLFAMILGAARLFYIVAKRAVKGHRARRDRLYMSRYRSANR